MGGYMEGICQGVINITFYYVLFPYCANACIVLMMGFFKLW